MSTEVNKCFYIFTIFKKNKRNLINSDHPYNVAWDEGWR